MTSLVFFLLLASLSISSSASTHTDIHSAANDRGGGRAGPRPDPLATSRNHAHVEQLARSDISTADVHASSMHERRRRGLHGAVIFLPINGGEDVVFIYKFEEGREQVRPRSVEVTVITSLVLSVFVASTLMAIVWLSRHRDDADDADEHPLKYMDPFHVHDRSRAMRSLSGNVMQTLKESGQLHDITINPVYDSMADQQVLHPSNELVTLHASTSADDILDGGGGLPPTTSMLIATPSQEEDGQDHYNDHGHAMNMLVASGRRDDDDVEWQSSGMESEAERGGGGGVDYGVGEKIQGGTQHVDVPLPSPPPPPSSVVLAVGDVAKRQRGEETTSSGSESPSPSPSRPFDVLRECNIHENEMLTLTKMMNAQERLIHAHFRDSQLRRLSMSLSAIGTKIARHVTDSKLATTQAYDVLVRHIKAARADGDAVQVALLAERQRRENEGEAPVSSSMPFTNQEKINSALRQMAILLDANRTRFVYFMRRSSANSLT